MDWVLSKIREHEEIKGAEKLDENLIKIDSKKHGSFIAGVMKEKCVESKFLESFIELSNVEFILNIPKDSIWTGESIRKLESNNIAFGGLGDFYRVVNSSDEIKSYKNPEFHFIERGLCQHDQVSSITRIFDKVIKVERYDLPTLTIAYIVDYELTADSVRNAREKYGSQFSIILNSNPNGRPTSQSYEVAKSIGVEIYKWGELLGRLNKK